MEGGGGHAPPRSARLRGPPPPFSRATSTSARFARRPNSWNATLSLRYGALTRRRDNVSRSASGAQKQTRAYTRSAQSGPRDTRSPRPKDRPPRAVGCARPSLTSSLGRGKPPRQLTALGWPPRAPDSSAFATLQGRSIPPPPDATKHHEDSRDRLLLHSAHLPLRKTAETGDPPAQRITSPSYGNARRRAGLRCGLDMRWPPTRVWHLAGQANSSFLPPSSACPSRSQSIATPRPTTGSQS